MANGFPQGFPSPYDVPQAAPTTYGPQPMPYVPPPAPLEVVPFAAQPEALPEHGRRGGAWTGVWVVAGGVVGLAGLLAWVATKNDREHTTLRREIEGTNFRLDDYIDDQSIEHAKIAQRQAVVDDYLSRNVDRLWTTMGVPWASRKTMPMESAPVPPMAASLSPYVEPSYAKLMADIAEARVSRSSLAPLSSHRRTTASASLPLAAAYEAEGLSVPSFRAVTSPYSRTLSGMAPAPVSRAYVEAFEEATAFPALSEAPTQVFSSVPSARSLVLSQAPSTALTGNGAVLEFSVPRSARSTSFRPPTVVPVETIFSAPVGPASAGLMLVPSVAPTLRSGSLPTLTALVTQRTAAPRSSRSHRIGDGQPVSSRSSRGSRRSTRKD